MKLTSAIRDLFRKRPTAEIFQYDYLENEVRVFAAPPEGLERCRWEARLHRNGQIATKVTVHTIYASEADK